MQKIEIIGNVGRAAEIKNVGAQTVAEFSVGVSSGKGNTKTTAWFRCSLWGNRATTMLQYLVKGTKVYVGGSYQDSIYSTTRGENLIDRKITVQDLELLHVPQTQQEEPVQRMQQTAPVSSDDLPF